MLNVNKKPLARVKGFNKVLHTSLPSYAKKAVFRRFLRTFIPQIPAALAAGIKARSFWVGFGLTMLGALVTALDKCLREKHKIYEDT